MRQTDIRVLPLPGREWEDRPLSDSWRHCSQTATEWSRTHSPLSCQSPTQLHKRKTLNRRSCSKFNVSADHKGTRQIKWTKVEAYAGYFYHSHVNCPWCYHLDKLPRPRCPVLHVQTSTRVTAFWSTVQELTSWSNEPFHARAHSWWQMI